MLQYCIVTCCIQPLLQFCKCCKYATFAFYNCNTMLQYCIVAFNNCRNFANTVTQCCAGVFPEVLLCQAISLSSSGLLDIFFIFIIPIITFFIIPNDHYQQSMMMMMMMMITVDIYDSGLCAAHVALQWSLSTHTT